MDARLRVNVDNAWVVICQPGRDPFYRDIEQSDVAEVLADFKAIDKDPERFRAFVSSIASTPS